MDALQSQVLPPVRFHSQCLCALNLSQEPRRILDPLLFTLLDPAVKHHQTTLVVAGVNLPSLVYRSTFDQARVHHILDDLLSLARVGGPGFIRIAKGSFLKHTLDPAFRERVRACESLSRVR